MTDLQRIHQFESFVRETKELMSTSIMNGNNSKVSQDSGMRHFTVSWAFQKCRPALIINNKRFFRAQLEKHNMVVPLGYDGVSDASFGFSFQHSNPDEISNFVLDLMRHTLPSKRNSKVGPDQVHRFKLSWVFKNLKNNFEDVPEKKKFIEYLKSTKLFKIDDQQGCIEAANTDKEILKEIFYFLDKLKVLDVETIFKRLSSKSKMSLRTPEDLDKFLEMHSAHFEFSESRAKVERESPELLFKIQRVNLKSEELLKSEEDIPVLHQNCGEGAAAEVQNGVTTILDKSEWDLLVPLAGEEVDDKNLIDV